MGGVNVEKAELIRPGGIVGAGGFDRIARIAQTDKIDALDHTAIGDIETGDHTSLQHMGAYSVPARGNKHWR